MTKYPMWKFKAKAKFASQKQKAKAAIRSAGMAIVDFVRYNPGEAAAIASAAGLIATKATKAYVVHAEDRRRKCDFYDPRTGDHVVTKKPLSQKQHVAVDRRYRENRGESYVSIFDSMGIDFK